MLKGQELIENAKIKNLKNDFQGIAAAHYGYMDRYSQLPGDDSKAVARWSLAASATTVGDGVLAGGFNAGCANNAFATENCAYWLHLRKAGYISGDATGSPRNAYGGGTSIHAQATLIGGAPIGTNICMTGLPAKAAEAIDAGFDDGNPATGNVRATLVTVAAVGGGTLAAPGTTAATAYADVSGNQYTVCKIL